jgi:DNA repair exonuclease SbcCD ATPase subunit
MHSEPQDAITEENLPPLKKSSNRVFYGLLGVAVLCLCVVGGFYLTTASGEGEEGETGQTKGAADTILGAQEKQKNELEELQKQNVQLETKLTQAQRETDSIQARLDSVLQDQKTKTDDVRKAICMAKESVTEDVITELETDKEALESLKQDFEEPDCGEDDSKDDSCKELAKDTVDDLETRITNITTRIESYKENLAKYQEQSGC